MARVRFASKVTSLGVLAVSLLSASSALADNAGGFGVGGSARQLMLTRGYAEIFSDAAPAGTRTEGYSIEFSKEGERIEFVLGLGYDNLRASSGYYLQSGGSPSVPGQVEFVEFDNFEMYTVDATVIGTWRPHPVVGLRYGAGLGVGLVRGEIVRTSAICDGDNVQSDCEPDPMGEKNREATSLPPALPVLRALVGLQLRPAKAIAINLDLGLRNVPYAGASLMFYLW